MFSNQLAAPRVLTDVLLPPREARGLRTDLLLAVLFSGLVAASAYVRIPLPFTPVPITGQTFAVLFTGAVLGGRRAALALLLYLVEGMAGLPVFAGGAFGAVHLIGPTGGYLLSYPLAAGCVGKLAERGWDRTPARAAAAMTIASLIILLTGVLWLAPFVGGVGSAIAKGLLPFLPGDLIKIGFAALLLPSGWKLVDILKKE
jgi:biotin transport system substrate-specific component